MKITAINPTLHWQQVSTSPARYEAYRTWPTESIFSIERDGRKWKVQHYTPSLSGHGSVTGTDYAGTLLSAQGLATRWLQDAIERVVR